MIVKTIDFTVTADAVTPNTPQAAGHVGDHRAVLLRFTVPFEECRYRLEIVDGCGGYDTTALLDAAGGVVSYEIPSSWTAAGVATVRLIAVEESADGEEYVRYHFAPVHLTFADREDGELLSEHLRPAWQETLDEAQFFLNVVEQKLQNGDFNGKDGEKGEKGDAGYTPQKGVDYYTEAEREALIAELGARDVDGELDAESDKAIANRVVTERLTYFDNAVGNLGMDYTAYKEATTQRLSEAEQTIASHDSGISEAYRRMEQELMPDIEENAAKIGDVATALDGILAIQNALIGGAAK